MNFTPPYSVRKVVRVEGSVSNAIRAQLTKAKKKEFRRSFRGAPSYFQIHHILPLSLGGSNDWNNLSLVDPTLHILIHDFIDAQTEHLKVGEETKIKLPMYEGAVWFDSVGWGVILPERSLAGLARLERTLEI
jgi:hypothetical protein